MTALTPPRLLLTAGEAAQRLGVGESTVRACLLCCDAPAQERLL